MSLWSLSCQGVIFYYHVNFPHQFEPFMDDLLLSSSLSKIQELLNYATRPLSWGRLPVKASKSGGLMIDSGKIVQYKSLCMAVGLKYQTGPSTAENPVSKNPDNQQSNFGSK